MLAFNRVGCCVIGRHRTVLLVIPALGTATTTSPAFTIIVPGEPGRFAGSASGAEFCTLIRMNLTAFVLVVAAACLHACWNLTAKRVSGNLGVLWMGTGMAGIVLAPFGVASAWHSFDPAGLPYLLATAVIHAAYFALLAAGYRHGELSTVYPLARGDGVAGTALLAWAVIGERPSSLGVLGLGAICLGILLLGLRERYREARTRSWLLALLVGFTITGYSVVDKLGVGVFHPVVYLAGLATGT